MRKKSINHICKFCGDDASIPNPSYQLATGSLLNNRYMAGRAAGQGGFGITYTGWDIQDNSRVAIKEYFLYGIVMRDSTVSPEISCGDLEACNRFTAEKERFLREYKVLSELSGIPGLVRVKDCFSENNTVYIVMDYLEGITLKQYVTEQGGKLSAKETFRILEPVVTSLEMVHKAGLIHRDVSPDNIIILKDGSARLLDFGIVYKVHDYVTGKKPAIPTEALIKRGYTPLEQYQSTGNLGPWTDVYALCATACFCLTGKEPPEAVERLMQDKPVLLRDIGAEISEYEENVLKKGMALRTYDRIPDMQKLYNMLFHIRQTGNIYKKDTPGKHWLLFCQRRWQVFILAASIVCVIAFSSYYNMRPGSNKVIVVPLYFKENIEDEFESSTWVNIRGTVNAYSDAYTLSCNIYLPKQAFKKEPLSVFIHSRLDIGGEDYDGGTMEILYNLRLLYENDEIFLVPDNVQDNVRRIAEKERYYHLYNTGDYYKVEIKDLPYHQEVHFGDCNEVLLPVDTSRGGELALNINLSASGQKLSSAACLDNIILNDNGMEVYSFDGSWESLYGYQYFCNCLQPDGKEERTETPEIGQIYLKEE